MVRLGRFRYLLVLLVIPFLMPSCSVFDPPTVVPAYGHIDSIHFNVPVDSSTRLGTASANIPYAWVYLDDNPVGSFQMPCTFPIIASNGVHNIQIYSGIDPASGNTALSINPFYQYYSVNVTLQQGVTAKFHPVSTYYTWVKFPFKENFEGETPGNQPSHIHRYNGSLGATDTEMLVTSTHGLVFQGSSSGMVVVDTKHHYYIGMSDTVTLPTTGIPVYVELNYRATSQVSVGIFEGDTVNLISPTAILYPTTTWKKMYISLNNTIQTFTIIPYRLYFAFARDTITPHQVDTLLLDNIKIDD